MSDVRDGGTIERWSRIDDDDDDDEDDDDNQRTSRKIDAVIIIIILLRIAAHHTQQTGMLQPTISLYCGVHVDPVVHAMTAIPQWPVP